MPPERDQINLELLLREAVTSVAVTAYSHGIGLTAQIDNRLPSRVWGDYNSLNSFLRRGLARTVESGRTQKIGLALWLDDDGGAARILLEACRTQDEVEKSSTRLADLWALPVGGGIAHPFATRQSSTSEAALFPLPCEMDADAPLMGEKWGDVFRGRYIQYGCSPLIDQERASRSAAAVGLELGFATTPGKILEVVRNRVQAGGSVDFLVLDVDRLGAAAVEVARELRADPQFSGVRTVLTGDTRSIELSDDDAALFDAVQRITMPWRQLMDVLLEVAHAPAGGGLRQFPHKAKPKARSLR